MAVYVFQLVCHLVRILDFHEWFKIMMSSLHALQTLLLNLMRDLKLIPGNTEVSLNYI